MKPVLPVLVALTMVPVGAGQDARLTVCGDDGARAALTQAATLMDRFDDSAALKAVRSADDAASCPELSIAGIALAGWTEARALAPIGGDRAKLGGVNAALRELDAMAAGPSGATTASSLALTYAMSAIRAATAAAQDERDEMQAYLSHAADTAGRIEIGGRAFGLWPLASDLLAGELLLEVDLYAAARDRFEGAWRRAPTPRAALGLGRVLDRLGDVPGACEAFARADSSVLPAAVRAEVERALARPACQATAR